MTTIKKVAKNGAWLVASQVVLKLITAFVLVFLIRYLGDEAFGQYSFAIAFVGFFALITDFGFNSLIVRDIAKNKSYVQKYFSNVMTLKIFMSIISIILITIVTLFINKTEIVKILIFLFTIELIMVSFSNTIRSFFQAFELMEYIAISKIIEKLIWAVLVMFFISKKMGLAYFVLALIISVIVGFLILIYAYKKKIDKISLRLDKDICKMILIESLPFALTSIFVLILFKLDTVMLSFMKTDVEVGLYAAAYKIVEVIEIIPNILTSVVYPVFSRLHQNKEKLDRALHLVFRFLFAIIMPISISILVLSDKIIVFLYTTSFFDSSFALKILIFASLFSFINYPLMTLLNSINKQRIGTINTAVAAVINIILNILLIPSMGMIGAAIATVIAEVILFILSIYFMNRYNHKIPLLKIMLVPFISSLIMGFVIFKLIFLNLFVLIFLSAVIYLSLILLFRYVTKKDISLVRDILEKKR
jgi:O-antigen/teichoic acid export membrane protein